MEVVFIIKGIELTSVRIDSNLANGSGGGLFSSNGEYIATASTLNW